MGYCNDNYRSTDNIDAGLLREWKRTWGEARTLKMVEEMMSIPKLDLSLSRSIDMATVEELNGIRLEPGTLRCGEYFCRF
jgi:hypothetical protein